MEISFMTSLLEDATKKVIKIRERYDFTRVKFFFSLSNHLLLHAESKVLRITLISRAYNQVWYVVSIIISNVWNQCSDGFETYFNENISVFRVVCRQKHTHIGTKCSSLSNVFN